MSGNSNAGPGDLEFATSVDGSVQQNVPLPPPPQTNGVLQGMIDGARAGNANPSYTSNATSADPSGAPSSSSSYAPSALPSALRFASSSHPTACLFHVLFKALAVMLYVFGPKAHMRDVLVTVLCVLLLAADFWVVKNVTGRLLVGLRWWNRVDPVTGNTSWIFEGKAPGTGTAEANAFDYRFFWGVLYLAPVLWGLFAISAVLFLKINCFVSLACALVLSSSNVYGYYKCSADQRERWSQWMDRGARMGVSAMLRGGVLGSLMSRVTGGGGGMQSVPQQEPNTMPGTFA